MPSPLVYLLFSSLSIIASRSAFPHPHRQVRQYEVEAASDYRLNYRLAKACKADQAALCAGTCSAQDGQVCGGTVLRCLTDKRDQIKDEACQKEVLYFEKMEVTDYRNDVILAAACR